MLVSGSSSPSPRASTLAFSWSSARRSTWWSSAYRQAAASTPGLAQRAAPHLLVAPRLLDQLGRAAQHRAHRRAQALGEVQPGGVEAGRVAPGLDARRHHGVEQPRAVEVRAQAVRAGGGQHLVDLLERPHPAAGQVGGLLDRHQPRAGQVAVGRPDGRLELLGGEAAAVAVELGRAWPRRSPPARRPRPRSGARCGRARPRRRPGAGAAGRRSPLHIVPLGRNRPRSWPSSSATRSWRRLTVGSSPRCSSPTSASAMARRMPSVGWVWVSL